MKSWNHFFRNGIACVVLWNDEGYHWGFIGINSDHPLNGVSFYRAGGIGLYSSLMKTDFCFENNALDEKYWMGFQSSLSLSFNQTVEDLKRVADIIQKEFGPDGPAEPTKSGGFKYI